MLGLVSLLKAVYPVLTPIIGKVFSGPNAKGHAGGATLAIAVAGSEIVSAILNPFLTGFSQGIAPAALDLGAALAGFIASYVVGFAITWLTANTRSAR